MEACVIDWTCGCRIEECMSIEGKDVDPATIKKLTKVRFFP